jgi:hypothetical protein
MDDDMATQTYYITRLRSAFEWAEAAFILGCGAALALFVLAGG